MHTGTANATTEPKNKICGARARLGCMADPRLHVLVAAAAAATLHVPDVELIKQI